MFRVVFSEGDGARAAASKAAAATSAGGGDALAMVASGMPGGQAVAAAGELATSFTRQVTGWSTSVQGFAAAVETSAADFAALDAARAAAFRACVVDLKASS